MPELEHRLRELGAEIAFPETPLLASALDRWSECHELFDEALAYTDRLRSPVLRALTELDYARALRADPRAGERRQRLLASVADAAQALALPGLLGNARS